MRRAHGLMFHHFHGSEHPAGQGSISGEDLVRLIEHIGPERIVPADEWMRRATAERLSGGDVCLTFDDNLRCQYDIAAPVLRRYGLTAFWFVYTSVLDGGIVRLEVYRRFRTTMFATVDDFYAEFFARIEQSAWAGEIQSQVRAYDPRPTLASYPFYSEADVRFRYVRDRVLKAEHYEALMDEMITSHGLTLRDLARGLWMDAGCLRALHAEGHVIGLHSHTHPTLMHDLSVAAQEQEYRVNHACLRDVLGGRRAPWRIPLVPTIVPRWTYSARSASPWGSVTTCGRLVARRSSIPVKTGRTCR